MIIKIEIDIIQPFEHLLVAPWRKIMRFSIVTIVSLLLLLAGCGGKEKVMMIPVFPTPDMWYQVGSNTVYGEIPGPLPNTVTLIIRQGEIRFPAGLSVWGDTILIETQSGLQTAVGPCKVVNSPWPGRVIGRGGINFPPGMMGNLRTCEFLQVTPVGYYYIPSPIHFGEGNYFSISTVNSR